jgi:hypothetical protein
LWTHEEKQSEKEQGNPQIQHQRGKGVGRASTEEPKALRNEETEG